MSTQPSTEYRQHHDVVAPQIDAGAFRQGWRVETRLDWLLVEGAIDPATHAAGLTFRTDWETGLDLHARSPAAGRRTTGAAATDGGAIARLGALARLRAVNAALGAFDCRLLQACVILDRPWSETARQLGVSRTTVRSWTITALRRLAEHCAKPG